MILKFSSHQHHISNTIRHILKYNILIQCVTDIENSMSSKGQFARQKTPHSLATMSISLTSTHLRKSFIELFALLDQANRALHKHVSTSSIENLMHACEWKFFSKSLHQAVVANISCCSVVYERSECILSMSGSSLSHASLSMATGEDVGCEAVQSSKGTELNGGLVNTPLSERPKHHPSTVFSFLV